MLDAYFICTCDYCGDTRETYIPYVGEGIVVDQTVAQAVIENKLKWGYMPEDDHFMCTDCLKKPQSIVITNEEIMDMTNGTKEKELHILIRKKIAKKLHINSDDVKADEIVLNCFTLPAHDTTEVRVRPKTGDWLDLKKRHPVKESDTGCL